MPPGQCAACASAFAEAAIVAGLQGVGTPNAAAHGTPPATADAVGCLLNNRLRLLLFHLVTLLLHMMALLLHHIAVLMHSYLLLLSSPRWHNDAIGANGAQFMKDTVPALCTDIPLESFKLAIETVLCAPPITDPYKKGIDKEFGYHGIVWKGDNLHCIPCNAKINGSTRQNVIDHVISDDHDDRLWHSAFSTQFHFAPGYEIRQQQREQRAE